MTIGRWSRFGKRFLTKPGRVGHQRSFARVIQARCGNPCDYQLFEGTLGVEVADMVEQSLPESTYELRLVFDSSQPMAATVLKEKVKDLLNQWGRPDFVDAFADGSSIGIDEAANLLSLGPEDTVDYMPMSLYDFDKARLEDVGGRLVLEVGERFLRIEMRRLDTQAWNQAWQESFAPWNTARFYIMPVGHNGDPPHQLKSLSIEAGEVFGTGQHATTRACLLGLERYVANHDVSGMSLLDIGTGTGILALAARHLGFGRVVGTDLDESILATARRNAAHSGIAGIEWRLADQPVQGLFEVVTCNILLPELVKVLPTIQKSLTSRGVALLSGFVDSDRSWVREEALRLGLVEEELLQEVGWDCIRFRNTGEPS